MRSMTGYGRSVVSVDGREMTLEIRSVNHRFLDLALRLPRNTGFIEDELRRIISRHLSRGHIDVTVLYANHRQDAKTVFPDVALANAYKTSLTELQQALDVPEQNLFNIIVSMPDVLVMKEAEEDQDAVNALLREALETALSQLEAMRIQEGNRLCQDLMAKVDELEALVAGIKARAPRVVDEYRTKLESRLKELLNGNVDEARFATEVAIFADRAAIDEELVRLESHIHQIRGMANSTEAVGRKLDFLAQEFNREMNTIGSKASDGEIAALVIEAKAIIEKIREQVQNIE